MSFRKLTISFVFFLLVVFMPFISVAQTTTGNNQSADRQKVYIDDFCRNTFYSWTTEEQINALRQNKTLLIKSRSNNKSYSLFDLSLRSEYLKNNVFAQMLQEEQFEKKRFAWTNGWATIMGWEKEKYGDQLIKIVLSDSAIVGEFDAYPGNFKPPLRFFDMSGKRLDEEYVLKNKRRIAVVYHYNLLRAKRMVHRIKYPKKTTGKYMNKRFTSVEKNTTDYIPFREYVILNEGMIKSWSHGTKDIEEELKSEINTVNEFRNSAEAKQTSYQNVQSVWGFRNVVNENIYARYYSLTCFENNYYLFNHEQLQAIVDKLQSALTKQSAELIK